MRVVSLVPSLTETALAWGVDVVACSRFCEQPQLLHVGGTKDPDVASIVELRPDLVLLDREENRREDAEALAAAGIALHITHVTGLDDVASMLSALGRALDVGRDVVGATIADLAVTTARLAARVEGHRTSAFVPIWRRPWMTIGAATYGASLLAALGIDTVPSSDEPYPVVELDEVAGSSPQLVLLPSEPYPFADRHIPEVQATLPAAVVRLIDGRDLFWWGVRTSAAMQRLTDDLREELARE